MTLLLLVFSACSGTNTGDPLTGTPSQAPAVTDIRIAPGDTTVGAGGAILFRTATSWSGGGSASTPSLLWTAERGYVSHNGAHTAAFLAGTYRVIAALPNGSLADTALVTVEVPVGPPATVTELGIEPRDTSVSPGQPIQFRTIARWSDSSSIAPPLLWTVERGTISSLGLHTADTAQGTYRVIAVLDGGALADTSFVTADSTVPLPPPPPPAPPPPPPPQPPSPPGSWREPPGYSAIVGRHFSSLGQTNPLTGYGFGRGTGLLPWLTGLSEGWDDVERLKPANITLSQDSTAPLSPPSLLHLRYPPQGPINGTYSPGVVQTMGFTAIQNYYGPARHYTKLYFRTAFRVSANWQGHEPSSTNKMFFIRSQGPQGYEPIVRLRGSGAGPLQLNVHLQGSERDLRYLTNSSLVPNQGVAEANAIVRGKWYVLEGVLEVGTNGLADGRLQLWLNGVLTHDYRDIEYEPSPTINRFWDYLHIAPTWGGGGGTINQLMWLDFDDFYISGAP